MSNVVPTIGIVLPCFNEEEILQQTDKKIASLLENLIQKKLMTEDSLIVYVDDGSTDNTWELIQAIVNNNKDRVGIKFSRNFGHQSALLGGITNIYQRVDCVITIDADLQDDIRVIEDMLVNYSKGFDIVYGVRKKETLTIFSKGKQHRDFMV